VFRQSKLSAELDASQREQSEKERDVKATLIKIAVICLVLIVRLCSVSSGETVTLQPDGDVGKDVSVMGGLSLNYVINHPVGLVFPFNSLWFGVSLVEFDLANVEPVETVTSALVVPTAFSAVSIFPFMVAASAL